MFNRRLPLLKLLVLPLSSLNKQWKIKSAQSCPPNWQRQVLILASIEIESLNSSGIKGIILDLDNTVISEDDRYLSPGAEAWIQQAKLLGFKFFILSNGKRRYRVKYWSHRLDIQTINPARKPFPVGFRRALAHMQLKPKQVVVIGDSRHTDILGAYFSGCLSIQVASLPHPPRWWEKLAGKWVQMPYPLDGELLAFESEWEV
ncbi:MULTISPECIES: YqeG family HAD IIIA-type phosphatase [unclassified Coleofasciculus]|uniref:YqeG family HAD IIIA-type phosphatase n=1 Tax=unclassified Coleofasciculus TaxID=2692782 RepID=UPI00187FA68A|nr:MULTISPECIES: YqeG family HAD IIIA-type phosphatase [unclassified Coleofasciculus]MBE9125753.1 YqeG family HAD IIIA-type phosphatase [Coleofasciculus sp. LEGE 07081]MBE9147241.1 YqeG family HAD IIIA-type phosphatase [Coleofasciculus sp. LEGE 07092]